MIDEKSGGAFISLNGKVELRAPIKLKEEKIIGMPAWEKSKARNQQIKKQGCLLFKKAGRVNKIYLMSVLKINSMIN